MKLTFTLFTMLFIGATSFGQIFQSDLSSWAGGNPTDWMGSATNIAQSAVVEQTVGVQYGTSMASLINTTTTHKRFTTESTPVVAGQTYTIKMWVAADMGDLRTNYYDETNTSYGTYNPYFDMAVESAGNLVMLQQNVTIPAGCTDAQFILSVRNTNPATAGAPFFLGIIVDSVSIEVASITYAPMSIYDIQYLPSGSDSPELGNYVDISGVVTGVWPGEGYWIQDAAGEWNGIFIDDLVNTPSVDDSVSVQGQVAEFFGLTQIENIASYTLEPAPAVIPAPAAVSSAVMDTEGYESVLVALSAAECTNQDAGFGNWTVNNNPGTPADSILISDDLYSYTCPVLGDNYDVTGIGHYSFSEYKILPRDVNDINGGAGCGMLTIYDIQYTTDMSGDSPENGNVVTTSGIVTGIFQIGTDVDRFFIQDGDGAWNGIFIYENSYTVALGDSVVVTGEVQEFNGLTEIGFVSNVTIASSGNAQPNPALVTNATVNDEEWEGVLVTLEDGICTVVTNGFGEWEVNDGTAAGDVKIDDDLLPASFTSILGDAYDVTGVRHYTFGESKIYPRSNAEIITVGFSSIDETTGAFTIYPNPAAVNVVINADAEAIVSIYAMTGALVAKGVSNKTIDVSDLDAGVYQVIITVNGKQMTKKLVIR